MKYTAFISLCLLSIVGCAMLEWTNDIKIKFSSNAEQLGYDTAKALSSPMCISNVNGLQTNPYSDRIHATVNARAEWHKGYVKFLSEGNDRFHHRCNCRSGGKCECGVRCNCKHGDVGDVDAVGQENPEKETK